MTIIDIKKLENMTLTKKKKEKLLTLLEKITTLNGSSLQVLLIQEFDKLPLDIKEEIILDVKDLNKPSYSKALLHKFYSIYFYDMYYIIYLKEDFTNKTFYEKNLNDLLEEIEKHPFDEITYEDKNLNEKKTISYINSNLMKEILTSNTPLNVILKLNYKKLSQ